MKRPSSGAGVGASSIMLIIVVLCLTLFGVLSLVTARQDMALTARTRESVQRYYETDALAQRALMAVDEWIQDGMTGKPDSVALTEDGDKWSFSVSKDEAYTLHVRLRIEDGGYVIERYAYENTAAWSAGTAEDLFD